MSVGFTGPRLVIITDIGTLLVLDLSYSKGLAMHTEYTGHTKYAIAAIVLSLLATAGGVWFAATILTHQAIGQERIQLNDPPARTSTHTRPQCLLLC
jgi:hypothetical protein